MEHYFLESNSKVSKSIGLAIGDIAKVALPLGEWNELFIEIS